MNALIIDRGDADFEGCLEETYSNCSLKHTASSSRRISKVQMVKTAAVLLVGASAVTFLQSDSHDITARIKDRYNNGRDNLLPKLVAASDWVNQLPEVIDTRRTMIMEAVMSPNSKLSRRTKTLTSEGSDMVWEQSQRILRQLRLRREDSKKGVATEGNVLLRAFGGLQGIFDANRKDGKKKGVVKGASHDQGQREDELQAHRRLNAADPEEMQTHSEQDVEGLFLALSSSPIAAAILIFCGIIFLIASVTVASDDSRRLRRLAASPENITIVLDEEEAEIVEFYEKEMESGMMHSFSLLEDDSSVDDCRDDTACEEQQLIHSIIKRPSSDSSLTRHLSGEGRVSQCDSYYSRVLHDITSFDDLEDEQEDEEDEPASSVDEEEHLTEQNGESSTLRDEVEAEGIIHEPQARHVEVEGHIDASFQAHSNDEGPISSESSISSLTSEMYVDAVSSIPQSQEEGQILPICNATLPTRSMTRKKKRSVSFSPQVRVREIPRQVNSEMSPSEKYLYLMLLTVAVVITFCSLLPTPHPSLSVPIADLTAGEMIQRADTILSSQWEVEL